MSARWGVYGLQAKDVEGRVVAANSKAAQRWFVRWRVDGRLRKRTFKTKGYARTFRDQLLRAELLAWPCDSRGWPLDPAQRTPEPTPRTSSIVHLMTVREYCESVWWPIVGPTFDDKNGLGHRTNMRMALDLLVYRSRDARLDGGQRQVGNSVVLADLVADDLRRVLVERRSVNLRTRALNERRIAAGFREGVSDVAVESERAAPATVRAFFVTMQMFVRSAMRSGHTIGDPLAGVAAMAPSPPSKSVSSRVVPSVEEVFDLAEAIAGLGPRQGRHHAGDRFRSLVLVAGTLGPRPGELVAHRPEWISWGDPVVLRFAETEASFYDKEAGPGGARTRPLKHRTAGESREVPALDAVASALKDHLERGYPGLERTWTSPTGRGRLNWGNLTDVYWRPACKKVFGGGPKHELAVMSPKTLRKAAITFWLDSGISPFLAADWAGHDEEVARRYYAGRSAATYAAEVRRLEGFASPPR